jgi:3'(2'), 5'-bisphosphate nucleotidase
LYRRLSPTTQELNSPRQDRFVAKWIEGRVIFMTPTVRIAPPGRRAQAMTIRTPPSIRTFAGEVDFALQAMAAAAALLGEPRLSSQTESLTKEDHTPVTAADFAVQAAVTGLLETSLPGEVLVAEEDARRLQGLAARRWMDQIVASVRRVHPAATEEQVLRWLERGARQPEERFWALDPVDGTKGLLRGGQFAAALALIQDGIPVIGALACPRYDHFGEAGCLALAVRGEGAWALPLGRGEWTRLLVSSTGDPHNGRLLRSVESGPATNRRLEAIRHELGMTAPELRMDSQVKYLALAAGEGDLLIRLPRSGGQRENTWDHAAGVLLVEEAGGLASDLNGERLDFGAGRQMVRNLGVVAGSRRLHEAALAALQRLGLGSPAEGSIGARSNEDDK